jgi:hypothetical protein
VQRVAHILRQTDVRLGGVVIVTVVLILMDLFLLVQVTHMVDHVAKVLLVNLAVTFFVSEILPTLRGITTQAVVFPLLTKKLSTVTEEYLLRKQIPPEIWDQSPMEPAILLRFQR